MRLPKKYWLCLNPQGFVGFLNGAELFEFDIDGMSV